MNIFKFKINTIVYLSVIVITIVAWLFIELYARQNDVDIDPILSSASETVIPNRYDEQTLKEFYTTKDLFYEKESDNSQ
ncbi:MAG: hypothetical protein KatS3mg084_0606 [Candidatus Dojkabacteria bacterium]|nr:MAG: hypothetical protein KatS3mg084_0606 [Candidatus Dojkabacteria bacterium]